MFVAKEADIQTFWHPRLPTLRHFDRKRAKTTQAKKHFLHTSRYFLKVLSYLCTAYINRNA